MWIKALRWQVLTFYLSTFAFLFVSLFALSFRLPFCLFFLSRKRCVFGRIEASSQSEGTCKPIWTSLVTANVRCVPWHRSLYIFPSFLYAVRPSVRRTLGRMTMKSTRRVLGHLLVCSLVPSHRSLIRSLAHSLTRPRAHGEEIHV